MKDLIAKEMRIKFCTGKRKYNTEVYNQGGRGGCRQALTPVRPGANCVLEWPPSSWLTPHEITISYVISVGAEQSSGRLHCSSQVWA